MTFQQHLKTTLDINDALRMLYPEKRLTTKTEQSTKERDKTTKR